MRILLRQQRARVQGTVTVHGLNIVEKPQQESQTKQRRVDAKQLFRDPNNDPITVDQ
jgi:hypothetical protein